jgi:hypothetical protein
MGGFSRIVHGIIFALTAVVTSAVVTWGQSFSGARAEEAASGFDQRQRSIANGPGQAECLPHRASRSVDPIWWRRRFRLRITFGSIASTPEWRTRILLVTADRVWCNWQ